MKKKLTLPNLLSASRLFMFPFLIYFAYTLYARAFAWVFIASLITDIADGYLARRLNQITSFGSKLDSWGDLTNFLAAIYGIYMLYPDEFSSYSILFIILFALNLFGITMLFLKFKKLIGMHLYSSKITGYVQGFFLMCWFLLGFNVWLFMIMFTISLLSYLEEIILILILRKPDHDLKGLFWVITERKDLWQKTESHNYHQNN